MRVPFTAPSTIIDTPGKDANNASGVGDIVRVDRITNAEKYRQVLINFAIPSENCGRSHGLESWNRGTVESRKALEGRGKTRGGYEEKN